MKDTGTAAATHAGKALQASIQRVRATRTLADLFRVYAREDRRIRDCGTDRHITALWNAYYSHIGNC